MLRIIFDTMIFDKLVDSKETQDKIRKLCEMKKIEIIIIPTVRDQLLAGPFHSIPEWFPVKLELESVFLTDYTRLGEGRLGAGNVYSAHMGNSKQYEDALIADAAHCYADYLVSDDIRCRERLKKITTECKAINFAEFITLIDDLS